MIWAVDLENMVILKEKPESGAAERLAKHSSG